MKAQISSLSSFGKVYEFSPGTELSEVDRTELMKLLPQAKLLLLRGLKNPAKDELLRFARGGRSSEEALVHWDFGPVMEMKVDEAKPNYLFSHEAVPYHWDGAFHEEPAALLFHCIQAPTAGLGGETLFANTESIYNVLTLQEKNELASIELTYRTEKISHYGGEITVNMIQGHPATGAPILRYAEPVKTKLNPVQMTLNGSQYVQEEIEERMHSLLYASKHSYSHSWQDGDILLADNYALVHGRQAFHNISPRHLRRIQIREFV